MEVLNRGEVVGFLTDPLPDMQYLNGTFTASKSAAGSRFAAAASRLDIRITYRDPTRAIRALIRETSDETGTVFLVMSLSDGQLFGRRVFASEAALWAISNVPE